MRILVESERDCYGVLGIIHTLWSPVPGRFKDYIAMPKFTLYQSLHTTVIGPQGNPVEVQIRTSQMHRRAEYGIAAHWKYKESNAAAGQDMTWLRQLVDWQRETQDPGEFLDSLRFDLHAQETFVFTPEGRRHRAARRTPRRSTSPTRCTPRSGHRCIGARVNGRLVPLESQLDNGDVVEVFTSKAESAGPSRDWMSFVTSPRARNKIRQWFARERREDAIDLGKEAISRAMRKAGLPLQRLMGGDALVTLARDLRFTDVSALYAAVGENHLSAQSVVQRLVAGLGGPEGAVEDIAETATPTRSTTRARPGGDPGVLVKGAPDVWAKLARCCTPVPGDAIVGFVTRGNGVSVHRSDCPNVRSLSTQPERMQEVEWAPTSGSVFLVAIQVEALDRNRLLSDVTRVLSDAHVNILSAAVSTTRDRVAISKFTFEMGDTEAPRAPAAAGPRRRGRVRRLSGDLRDLSAWPAGARPLGSGRCGDYRLTSVRALPLLLMGLALARRSPRPRRAGAQARCTPGRPEARRDAGARARCRVLPHAYCGRLRRPWDPSGEVKGDLTVGFAFVPASDHKDRVLGTVVPHEGGPGYSTTGSATDYAAMYGSLLERRNMFSSTSGGPAGAHPSTVRELQNLHGPTTWPPAPAAGRSARTPISTAARCLPTTSRR